MGPFRNMRFPGAAALALAWAYAAHAGTAVIVEGRLNHTKVQQAYLEADWNSLAKGLQVFLQKPGAKADRLDSICAFKYLGAVQASRPETRLMGEENFRRLLAVDPSFEASNLGDLFVSEEVLSLFRRVKAESRLPPPAPGTPAPASAAAPDAKTGWGKTGLWAAAGVGVLAAATVGTVYYLRLRDRPHDEVISIPFPPAENGP